MIDPPVHLATKAALGDVLADDPNARYRRSREGCGFRVSCPAVGISDRALIMSSAAGMGGISRFVVADCSAPRCISAGGRADFGIVNLRSRNGACAGAWVGVVQALVGRRERC